MPKINVSFTTLFMVDRQIQVHWQFNSPSPMSMHYTPTLFYFSMLPHTWSAVGRYLVFMQMRQLDVFFATMLAGNLLMVLHQLDTPDSDSIHIILKRKSIAQISFSLSRGNYNDQIYFYTKLTMQIATLYWKLVFAQKLS